MERPTVSLIIPVFHPRRELLERVVAAAQRQLLPSDEIIVVENGSDTLRDFSQTGLKLIIETKSGSAFARRRGMEAATGETIWFLDDDTIPATAHLAAGLERLTGGSRVAIVGGRVDVRDERGLQPAAPFLRELFGERPLGNDYLESAADFNEMPFFIPFTGGSLYRRELLTGYFKSMDPSFAGRSGTAGVEGCEDIEIAAHAMLQGWKVAYDPRMRVEHVISAPRLTFKYAARLSHGSGCSYGRFLVKHGFESRISKPGVFLRLLRRLAVRPPLSRDALLRFLQYAGRVRGRGAPPSLP